MPNFKIQMTKLNLQIATFLPALCFGRRANFPKIESQ